MLTRVKYPTLASICLTESHTALQPSKTHLTADGANPLIARKKRVIPTL
ncbi:hypothetical protein SSMOSELEY_0199 [Shigella sonnei str. Moseley]|nr:hypothetical protein SSMOSELEY_0199 [Shigella sonnei str. Moseley]